MAVKSRIVRIVLTCLLFIVAQPCKAQIWTSHITVEHPLTVNESTRSARQYAIKKLQYKAAEEVGAYVIRTEKLEDGDLKETIELISAAKVRLKNVVEKQSVSNGAFVLTVQADASVDTKELLDRVSYISENKALRSVLSNVTDKVLTVLSGGKDQGMSLELIKTYENILDRVLSHEEVNAFVGYTAVQLKSLLADIDINVFGYLIENTDIKTEIERIIDEKDHYIVNVRVGTQYDQITLATRLNQYWKVFSRNKDHPYSLVEGLKDSNSTYPASLNKIAYEYLTNHQLQLIIGIDKEQVTIPISYRGDNFHAACDVNYPETTSKHYCFSAISYGSNDDYLSTFKGNPIKFKVPKKAGSDLVVSSRIILSKVRSESVITY
ncbi:MAG: hypothetical protein QM504_11965 [Pseudomonadota bacterium]